MHSKTTWLTAGIATIAALLIILNHNRGIQPQEVRQIPHPESGNTGVHTSQAQLSTRIPPVTKKSIQPSPYRSLSPDSIRQAKARNEPWSGKYEISDTWTVQMENLAQINTLATQLNAKVIGPVKGFTDVFLLQIQNSQEEILANQIRKELINNPDVQWFEQELIETFALRYDESPPPFSDPLLPDQWHLRNKGDRWNVDGEDSNMYPAWNYGYSGAGIHIAIVDTGIEGDHPDLAPNYRSDLDYDYLDDDALAAPEASDETHGTSVAGVAAAAANESCGVGAAFNAELIGVRLIKENQGVSSSKQASAVTHRSDIVDIYNNSWGPDTDNGARMAGPGTLSYSALQNAIQEGRNGLGSIFVWAAGNGLGKGSNVNYDGWAANRYSIAVGSVGDHGKASNYSEPGAPMLVCAHSNGDTSGIRTTDLQGQAGADPGDCRIDFGGTSSAAPLVAGIVALMLEANPNLTWRDVQHILAKTAVKVATTDSDWIRNGAGYWVNHKFGFGRVDAAAAVRVAKDWIPVGAELELSSGFVPLNQTIPDNSNAGIQAFHSEAGNIRVEHVAVTLEIDPVVGESMDWGDFNIVLTSPSGTKSVLAEPHVDAQKTYSQWTYWSVRHLDEPSKGVWLLNVTDRRSGNKHIVKSWNVDIYGTEITAGDNHLPVAASDEFIITDSVSQLDVLANDTDEDGDSLEVISIYRSPHSELTLLPSGLIRYVPGDGLGGRDRFGYTMHDGRGGIRTAEVHLTIPIPDAVDDQVATSRNTPVSIPVLNNDIDPDGDNIRISGFSSPNHGAVEIEALINLKYTPDEGFTGVDRFTYSITDDDDGVASAEVTVYVTTEDDFALLFDGEDDQIVIENSTNQHLNTPFTIEAWIRPTGWGEAETGYGRILDKDSIIFYLHGTGFPQYNPHSLVLSLDHANGTNSIYNTPANSIQLNKWQHVAVTYDNLSQVIMYVDGVQQTLNAPFNSASGPLATSSQAMIIGEAANQLRAFKGAIDEFRIWGRPLITWEINNQMNSRLSGNESGLLIYYGMNEGAGSQTMDARAPIQNGRISGAKWIRGIIGNNTPPQTSTDEIQSLINEKLVIPVTANDSDPDGDELRVSRIVSVSEGSASISAGNIIYQPPVGFTGLVRIDYEVEDFYNGISTATLILIIGEGLYYSVWDTDYYGGGLGKPNEDIDGDSVSNFSEYAFGTDPLSGDSNPALWNLRYDRVSGNTLFTYTILKRSLDVKYKLLQSNDMVTWTIPIQDIDYKLISVNDVTVDTETRTLEFNPLDGQRIFLRLEAISLAGSE